MAPMMCCVVSSTRAVASVAALSVVLCSSAHAQATEPAPMSLEGMLRGLTQQVQPSGAAPTPAPRAPAPSTSQTANKTAAMPAAKVEGGVREALALGVERAVATLARPGGFLNDSSVRIPLPSALQRSESALRLMGQGPLVDEFVTSVNRAAEQAVPMAAPLLGEAIRTLSIADAQAILTGGDDAATRYFQQKMTPQLSSALLPLVREATASAGVTSEYKALIGEAGPLVSALTGTQMDVDEYVTARTLDGLFVKMAAEERALRADPVGRGTALLQQLFGASGR